ncbi:MAG TPA: carbohydrate ABC transporter permease [Mobilitalea sp.]|nr:carbohydrate ABC transporter permease [Mobilitalea sp.]
MKRLMKKRLSRSVGGDIGIFIFLLLFSTIMVIPLVYAVSMSLKLPSELWRFPPTFIVRNPSLKNYRDLFRLMTDSWVPMSRYIFNTLFITVVGTFGHIMIASLAAYPLSKYEFPFSNFFFVVIRSSLMFTPAVTAIPNYLIMSKLGLIDTYWALLLPAFGSSLGLFLMKQFMDQMIHPALLESADIDGATEFVKFRKIVMPMVKPAWLTLMIFSVQGLWGMGSSPFIYSEELKTLPYALGQIVSSGIARAGVGSAISIFLLVVPLTIFIISQSNIIETMATSGMKD